MVRLRELFKIALISTGIGFQFQYGAIKSDPNSFLEKTKIEFQFQYGAIKS